MGDADATFFEEGRGSETLLKKGIQKCYGNQLVPNAKRVKCLHENFVNYTGQAWRRPFQGLSARASGVHVAGQLKWVHLVNSRAHHAKGA